MARRIGALINKVAKLPARESYLWDEHASLVAAVLFHVVTMLRVISLLQWLKFAYRHYYGKDHAFQKRTNFHSFYTEIYFLVVITTLVCLLHTAPTSGPAIPLVLRLLALYFAIESVVWTTYYLFFRHFIERAFTIYHHAEYFLAFPLALMVQVLGLAIYLKLNSVSGLFALLFNLNYAQAAVPDSWKAALALLGVFYVVVLLANLRDAFPKTVVKPITAIAIIGAGEVVRQRLLPALVNPLPRKSDRARVRTEPVEINRKAIRVFDLAAHSAAGLTIELSFQLPNGRSESRPLRIKYERHPQDIVTEIASNLVPTIIATPPDSHFYYLSMLSLQGIRFAVEKPISVFEPEIRTLCSAAGEALFEQGFAMSYYALEKALPLTYLYRMNPVHSDYLDIAVTRRARLRSETLPWNELMTSAGKPKQITVLLLEGMERSPSASSRQWTENPYLGGLYYETAIHTVTVLQKVLGSLDEVGELDINALRFDEAVGARGCTFSWMSAIARSADSMSGTSIDLIIGKYMPQSLCARGALIEYEDLLVACDFDTMSLEARPLAANKTGRAIQSVDIRVKPSYRDTRYAVQAGLIRTFFEHGWRGDRYDDFADQRHVLRWLVKHGRSLEESQQHMKGYNADGLGLPAELAGEVSRYRELRPSEAEDHEAG